MVTDTPAGSEVLQLWKTQFEPGVTLMLRGDESLTYEEDSAMYSEVYKWCSSDTTLDKRSGACAGGNVLNANLTVYASQISTPKYPTSSRRTRCVSMQ